MSLFPLLESFRLKGSMSNRQEIKMPTKAFQPTYGSSLTK